MNLNAKISLVVSVLDELVTVGYLSNYRLKIQAVELIREILKHYTLPPKPSKADTTIYGLQILSKPKNENLNKQLSGLATLAEKALTELHDQHAKTH